ncbi:LysR family transcriptional regulator [Synergistales bacterium]|nr:LysR family transcriptional regulator [Synergistales bacterium]
MRQFRRGEGIQIDYRTLQYVITVAEEGSISKAAQKLYLSQPSLSHCILKQERKLGVTLFDRAQQPLKLTYAGERYVTAAHEILGLREQLEKEMDDIANDRKGRVVLGLTKMHSAYLLPRVAPHFRALYPDAEIVLVEDTISSLESMLITDRAEIAIIMTPAQNERLTCEHLYNDKFLLCLPKEHHLIELFENGGVDIALLKEEPFIFYKKGLRGRKIADVLFAETGIRPKVVLESQAAETILNLVSAGVGCAILPASIVQSPGNSCRTVHFTIGNLPLSSDFAFAWKRDSYVKWAAQEFIKITHEILSENFST